LPVKAVKIQERSGSHQIDFPGVIRANTQSALSFRVPGLINELPVKVGQRVQKGDLIARLDATHYENAVEQALAAQKQAAAQMHDAQSEYQRLQELWAKQDVSNKELQAADSAAETAEEAVHIAEKRLAEARRQLSYTRLEAPFNGIIAEKKVHAFQTVAIGQPVALLVDPTNMLFRVQLPTSLRPDIDFFKKYKCIFPALGNLEVDAELHGIGPSALPPIRTFPLTVRLFTTPAHPIMPGTVGNLRITMSDKETEDFFLLPASAVVSDHEGHSRVWIVDKKSGKTQPQDVEVEGLHKGKIAVKSGLKSGQWIITAGQTHLSPGRKVKIVNPFAEKQ
jgi:RND family efflux transporter MFP subunit